MIIVKDSKLYVIISLIAALVIAGGGWKIYQNNLQKEAEMQARIKAAEVAAERVAQEQSKAKEEAQPSAKTKGIITGTYVYMRVGPGTNYDSIGYFYRGETVKIIKLADDWYKVERKDGTVCWVSADYCETD